jgi:hypothetical protein
MSADSVRGTSAWRWIALGGLAAGAIDIAFAAGFWYLRAGVPPTRIFQSVAAGLLGRDAAVAGGWSTAALGLVLHFFIAAVVGVVYFAAARYAAALRQRPWIFGALYGVGVYGVMQYVVVPLSRAGGAGRPNLLWDVLSIVVHAVGVGIPVALAARAALRQGIGSAGVVHAVRPAAE